MTDLFLNHIVEDVEACAVHLQKKGAELSNYKINIKLLNNKLGLLNYYIGRVSTLEINLLLHLKLKLYSAEHLL